jgi:ABC-type polysaccharide/polyol phosphate export permease
MKRQTGSFFTTDLLPGIRDINSWMSLGRRDIKAAYRRSYLGIVWISLSMTITLVALSFVYSFLFPITLNEYLPFLAVSYVTWGLISSTLVSSCNVFIGKHSYIKQKPIPLTVFILSNLAMNVFIFFNHIAVALFFVVVIGDGFGWAMLVLPLSLAIIITTAFAVSMILGTATCRYRDIGQIISSVTLLAFFVTPILWKPEFLSGRFMIAYANPIYHYIELIRAPIIDHKVPLASIGITLCLTVFFLLAGYFIISRKRNDIPFWV